MSGELGLNDGEKEHVDDCEADVSQAGARREADGGPSKPLRDRKLPMACVQEASNKRLKVN